jgi:hypothetical protein
MSYFNSRRKKYVSGGEVGSTLGMALGTIIGGPVGGAIGSTAGNLIGGAFGKKNNKVKPQPVITSTAYQGYAMGGAMPLGQGAVKYKGPKHEKGGILIDENGMPTDNEDMAIAEVEGGETRDENYIFSDTLTVPGSDMTFAEAHEQLMAEGASEQDIEELKMLQEQVREESGIAAQEQMEQSMKNGGQMIKRADGSYSKRGLWDNIRKKAAENKRTGKTPKKPTAEMLRQEKRIRAAESKAMGGMLEYGNGGGINNPGFRALPDYVQAKIKANMEMGGMLDYMYGGMMDYKQGGIYIKPSKRGTFKAQASRMGMGVQEAASKILSAPEGKYSPAMRKKANFARNFAKRDGGNLPRPLNWQSEQATNFNQNPTEGPQEVPFRTGVPLFSNLFRNVYSGENPVQKRFFSSSYVEPQSTPVQKYKISASFRENAPDNIRTGIDSFSPYMPRPEGEMPTFADILPSNRESDREAYMSNYFGALTPETLAEGGTRDYTENINGEAINRSADTTPQAQRQNPFRSNSIVDYLNATGRGSSFADRKKLAQSLGMPGYKGTAAQNTELLNNLRGFEGGTNRAGRQMNRVDMRNTLAQAMREEDQLMRDPFTSEARATQQERFSPSSRQAASSPKSSYTGQSIVDYLKSEGMPSDYQSRKNLAAEYGIENYKGTAAQNKQLLNIMRRGQAAQFSAEVTAQGFKYGGGFPKYNIGGILDIASYAAPSLMNLGMAAFTPKPKKVMPKYIEPAKMPTQSAAFNVGRNQLAAGMRANPTQAGYAQYMQGINRLAGQEAEFAQSAMAQNEQMRQKAMQAYEEQRMASEQNYQQELAADRAARMGMISEAITGPLQMYENKKAADAKRQQQLESNQLKMILGSTGITDQEEKDKYFKMFYQIYPELDPNFVPEGKYGMFLKRRRKK